MLKEIPLDHWFGETCTCYMCQGSETGWVVQYNESTAPFVWEVVNKNLFPDNNLAMYYQDPVSYGSVRNAGSKLVVVLDITNNNDLGRYFVGLGIITEDECDTESDAIILSFKTEERAMQVLRRIIRWEKFGCIT